MRHKGEYACQSKGALNAKEVGRERYIKFAWIRAEGGAQGWDDELTGRGRRAAKAVKPGKE